MKKNSVHNAKRRSPHCRFVFADGRRCHLARAARRRGYCRIHASRAAALPDSSLREDPPLSEDAARELASISGEFKTSSDINHALGRLWSLFSEGRVGRRDAVALAYIGQLILQSLPSVRAEICNNGGTNAWSSTLESVFNRVFAATKASASARAAVPEPDYTMTYKYAQSDTTNDKQGIPDEESAEDANPDSAEA